MNEELRLYVDGYLEREIEALVHAKVKIEEEVRFRQLKWIAVFFGLVGIGSLGTLGNYLVEKAVDQQITRAAGNVAEALDFSKFYTVTLKVDLGTAFSQNDVDLIMSYLRKAADNQNVRLTQEFSAALFQVTKAFAEAGESSSLDEIFEIYQKEILASPVLVEALLHHYGQAVVASETLTEDVFDFLAFLKLERVAADSNVPEIGLVYRVLYESKKPFSENKNIVEAYLKRTVSLNERDRPLFFLNIFVRSRVENWVSRATPETVKIQEVVRTFFQQYEASLSTLYDLTAIPKLGEVALFGLDESESEFYAALIEAIPSQDI